MKKLLSLMLVAALVLSLSAMSVSAAPVDSSSNATLELTAGQLVIVDPQGPGPDPEVPGIEVGGKDMNFGVREVSIPDATYFALKAGITGADQEVPANYKPVGLIVSDARGAAIAKWDVGVKVSTFKNAALATTLPGFELTLKHAGTVTGTGTLAQTPDPVASVTLVGGAATSSPIFASKATIGSPGKWGGNWQPELLVKGSTGTVANHTAVVTWTLSETP